MNKLYTFFIFTALVLSTSLYAQTETFTVSGVVTDATTGETLVGANVYFPALYIGAASDVNGEYSITVVAGTHKMTCSYVGYEKIEQDIVVSGDVTQNYSLKDYQFTLSVTVMADRVKERETPVAYTLVDKEQMKFQ